MNRQTAAVVATSDAVRRPGLPPLPRGWRAALAALLLAAGAAALLVWGGGGDGGGAAGMGAAPGFRYVNSGWVAPLDGDALGAFSAELRAFVIVSQPELDVFEGGFVSKVSRGNAVSLGRIDFDRAALLAAYYVWRPLRGDPLSVREVRVDGGAGRAVVTMELDENPQGRQYPYLFAPMVMVAVERTLFPPGAALEFVFMLNGDVADVVIATPNPGDD